MQQARPFLNVCWFVLLLCRIKSPDMSLASHVVALLVVFVGLRCASCESESFDGFEENSNKVSDMGVWAAVIYCV